MEQSSLVDNEVASPMEEVSCAHVLFVFAVLDVLVVLVVLVVVKNIGLAIKMSLLNCSSSYQTYFVAHLFIHRVKVRPNSSIFFVLTTVNLSSFEE